MRTTARISLCALALLAAGIAGCRDDDRLSYEKDAQEGDVPPIGVQSISVLKSLYHDRTTRITREISIQGHIVANDTAGEFYKEIVVEDDTGGIVLSIDDERLYRTCRLFDFVTINCQGLTLGSEGALVKGAESCERVAARRVEAVDTTGAGDTFNGALAVALSEGRPLSEAVRFATAASAIAVTRMGAQSAVPMREEVDALLAEV